MKSESEEFELLVGRTWRTMSRTDTFPTLDAAKEQAKEWNEKQWRVTIRHKDKTVWVRERTKGEGTMSIPTDKLISELDDLINEGGKKQAPIDIAGQMAANLAKHWKNPSEHDSARAARDQKVKPSTRVKPPKAKPPALGADGSQVKKK